MTSSIARIVFHVGLIVAGIGSTVISFLATDRATATTPMIRAWLSQERIETYELTATEKTQGVIRCRSVPLESGVVGQGYRKDGLYRYGGIRFFDAPKQRSSFLDFDGRYVWLYTLTDTLSGVKAWGSALFRTVRKSYRPFDETPSPRVVFMRLDDEDWNRPDPGFVERQRQNPRFLSAGSGAGDKCISGGPNLGDLYLRYDDGFGIVERNLHKANLSLAALETNKVRLYGIGEQTNQTTDIWPTLNERSVFVLQYEFYDDDSEIKGLDTPKEFRHRWRGVWTLEERYPASFNQPFTVLPGSENDFFITELGELYATGPIDVDLRRTMRHIPLKDGQLVQAIVYDLDRNRTPFAFTAQYWFEVKVPIEYRAFSPPSFKVDEPMPALVECARQIRKFYPALKVEETKGSSK